MSPQSTTLISLGGSLICPPGGPDAKFLGKFRDLILKLSRRGRRFVIICGGGTVCRQYQKVGEKLGLTPVERDWVGIYATQFNALFVRALFRKSAHPDIVTDPAKAPTDAKEKVIFGAGHEPGCSTDTDAVAMAKAFGADAVVNLSNIKFVYDKDPNEHPDAKPFKNLTWKEYRRMFGGPWKPGLSRPFDPVASREAEKLGLRVAILDGADLKNVEKALAGEKFRGTEIV
jgi:uridylate kinase